MPESERASSPQPDRQRRLQATEAMRASMTHWATVRVQDERALVLPAPDLDALYAGLERALDGDWAAEYQVICAPQLVVTAQLRLADRTQGGLGQGHTLHDARLLALADALRAYGVAPASSEGQWVEYDTEEGANTHELEPHEAAPELNRPAPVLPPEPPRDPQLERARKHIDDLLEGLKGSGQGAQAARVLARRGYGNTVEESREVYKELKALKG